jgi:hypothetical protein
LQSVAYCLAAVMMSLHWPSAVCFHARKAVSFDMYRSGSYADQNFSKARSANWGLEGFFES